MRKSIIAFIAVLSSAAVGSAARNAQGDLEKGWGQAQDMISAEAPHPAKAIPVSIQTGAPGIWINYFEFVGGENGKTAIERVEIGSSIQFDYCKPYLDRVPVSGTLFEDSAGDTMPLEQKAIQAASVVNAAAKEGHGNRFGKTCFYRDQNGLGDKVWANFGENGAGGCYEFEIGGLNGSRLELDPNVKFIVQSDILCQALFLWECRYPPLNWFNSYKPNFDALLYVRDITAQARPAACSR